MKIAIIDADLLGCKRHKFPNLCCMKISGWHKEKGNYVTLKTDYSELDNFDKVYIAKVFTDTQVPEELPTNVIKGGTGFYFDKAKPLPPEIEHHMPDYHLYDGVCDYKTYTDYSIGFLTRGCFRHCPFCINRRSNKVVVHSPLEEFFDPTRKKICLLDDNFFGYDGWRDLLLQLQATGKPFVFKQGLDVRLLDEDKATMLFSSRYDGDFIFAFDNPSDAPMIKEKLKLIRQYTKKRVKFYILCGFDRENQYDEDFWLRDLQSVLDRSDLLKQYDCLPYVMRHKNYLNAPPEIKNLYTRLAEWGNQPFLFLKKDFTQYVAYEREYREQRKKRVNKL